MIGTNGHGTLRGGNGNDTLIGGTGNDMLVGGANSNDLYIFARGHGTATDASYYGNKFIDTLRFEDAHSGDAVFSRLGNDYLEGGNNTADMYILQRGTVKTLFLMVRSEWMPLSTNWYLKV
ncbi:hypothetical protein [Neisseria iguanae]|uniref:hypothetical protein n=1 Tax=Neisseria iguanae TaxID=90242 RepID=UPI0011B1CEF5|nr:hypothetical protein [Neisseria iguanae]